MSERTPLLSSAPRRRHAIVPLVVGATALATAIPAGITIAVVPIAVDAGADAVVPEGSSLVRTVSIVDAVDDGAAGWSYSIDYGDGLVTVGTTLVSSVALDHVYADGPATFTATVTVTDVPGDVAGDSLVVTVGNVAPVVATVAPSTITEGSTYSITVSGTDPAGVNDPLSMILDWGDGTFSTQSFRPMGTAVHVFRDDQDGPINATIRNVSVTVFDGDAISSVSVPVTVTDVAPVIAVSGAATTTVGSPYQLTLRAITDPGTDTVTSRIINWGDGTSDSATTSGVFAHTFTSGGTKNVAVDLVNEDGTHVGAGRVTVTVAPVAPAAPTGLLATAASRSSIRLTWTNTTTDQTSLQVERCKGAGCTTFTRVATLAGTTTSYLNTGLSSRTTYTYRVRAVNSVGTSPYSPVASATTLR